jgi:capsular exopolysaccharide synthesis family protein
MEHDTRTADEPVDVHLRDYLWVLRKHLGVAVTFFIAVVVAVTVVTFKTRPMYKATAELYIERQTPDFVSLRDMVDRGASPDEYRKTQHQLIRSRQIAGAVFRRNHLDKHPFFADVPEPIEAFRELVSVAPKEGTYLASVSVESPDPVEAAEWTNDLIDEYLSYVEQKHHSTSSEVQDSINKEIPKLRSKLLQSETRLIEFQRQDNVFSFEKQQEIYFRKVQELDTALTRVQKEKITLEARIAVVGVLAANGHGNGEIPMPALPQGVETPILASYHSRELVLVEELSQCASRYRSGHPRYKEAQDKLRRLRVEIAAEIQRVLDALADTLAVKTAEEKSLEALLLTKSQAIQKLDEKSNQYQALKSEVESSRSMYHEFLQRRKELESMSGLGTMNITIVDRALPPKTPVRPKKWLNLTLAIIVGLLGGVALAFFFEYLDDTVKTPEDIKDILGLPFLGLIPVISKSVLEEGRGLIVGEGRFSTVAEAFRTLRTGLSFAKTKDGVTKIVMITSPGPQEGKTLNSVNLAASMARNGLRVLLVDADLRKPTVHHILGLENDKGISTLCSGPTALDEAVMPTKVENLWALTSGPIPPNPSELLGSAQMTELLREMGETYDYVLIDTPPTGAVTDPVVLATQVDGVVVVVSAGTTRRKAAQHCAEQISRVHGTILGVVLNAFHVGRASYYRYAYYHSPYYRRAAGGEEAHDG